MSSPAYWRPDVWDLGVGRVTLPWRLQRRGLPLPAAGSPELWPSLPAPPASAQCSPLCPRVPLAEPRGLWPASHRTPPSSWWRPLTAAPAYQLQEVSLRRQPIRGSEREALGSQPWWSRPKEVSVSSKLVTKCSQLSFPPNSALGPPTTTA